VTGLALLSVVVIAACTGTLTALLVDRMRAEVHRFDAGIADLDASIDADRARRHRAGQHVRRGGVGDCLVCGLREGGAR